MKKLIYTLGILAVSAFTFPACQKEQASKDKPSNLVTVSFVAEKAGIDTKTAAVEDENSVSYIWTAEDIANMKLFVVGEDNEGKETLTPVANPTVTKVSETKLTISGQVAPNATYTFRAVLAGSWTNDGKRPRVCDTQAPSATNFDPNADVLVSEDKEVVVGSSEETTVSSGSLELSFSRLVVVNKMTLKNLAAGDNISKVVITSTKNLAGYFATNTLAASGDKKTITLNYSSATVPANGQFPIYFTTIPATGHVLTVEVTTDQYIYTKSFTEGKSIDFNIGQFTKFNFALPAGVANTALTLPVEDNMAWATTGGSDETSEMSTADLTAMQGTKKIYDSASKAYKGGDGIKLGTKDVAGSITTNNIDLSSAFYVAIDAKTYGSDESQLKIQVDGSDVYTSPDNLTSSYETYYVNCDAATATSNVTITITGKRGYINNLEIGAGTYVAHPKINVTSSNPIEVANTASSQTINYTIDNPTSATLTATTEASWIKNIDYATSGSVTFNVDAQESGAASREATITLAYTGAKSVNVTVSQAAGTGGTSTFKYIFTSKDWEATLNDATANWTNDKSGYGTEARGISVQKANDGAGATSPVSFTSISNITISLSKSAKGVGSVDLYVGTTKVGTQSDFTTSATEYSFNVSNLSGNVSFVVNCTTSTLYVRDIAITATSINVPTAYAINCATSIAHGSISADKATAYEGDEVSLTATPEEGYQLGEWTVTKATSGDAVTVTGGKFTMPADNVNVTATFVAKVDGDPTTVSMTTFSEISGNVGGDTNVSYAASKGDAGTAPAVNGGEIRIYQNGGLLTITANNGKKITAITIGSSMVTTVQTKVDNGEYSSNNNIAEGGTYTIDSLNASSVVFKCTGTDKNHRLYLNSLSVTYK